MIALKFLYFHRTCAIMERESPIARTPEYQKLVQIECRKFHSLFGLICDRFMQVL